MAILMIHFVLAFVLAVQPVIAPDMSVETPTVVSAIKDPCVGHTVACNPTTPEAKPIIIISSIINVILAVPAIIRVWGLKRKSRSEDDTLYWWHLCFSSGGFFAWVLYFWKCSSADLSSFPIFVVSLLLAVLYFILLCWATLATCCDTDKRLYVMITGPSLLWLGGTLLWLASPVQGVGWWGCAVISLAQSFRVTSTNYRDNTVGKIRTFPGWLSLLGAIGGGLWLINPQLCYSREFKVTSYAVGLLRAWEMVQWISRPVARTLSKIEGQMVDNAESAM